MGLQVQLALLLHFALSGLLRPGEHERESGQGGDRAAGGIAARRRLSNCAAAEEARVEAAAWKC